jgi:hypothetical protein
MLQFGDLLGNPRSGVNFKLMMLLMRTPGPVTFGALGGHRNCLHARLGVTAMLANGQLDDTTKSHGVFATFEVKS